MAELQYNKFCLNILCIEVPMIIPTLEAEPEICEEGMLQFRENLDFSKNISQSSSLHTLGFSYIFHSIHLAWLASFLHNANFTKAAFSDRSENLKVIEIYYKEKSKFLVIF